MRSSTIARALQGATLGALMAGTALAAPPAAPDPGAPDTEYTETLPAMGAHWVMPATENDAYTLYNGDSGKILGTIPASFEANIAVSPDRRNYYVSETIWSRGDHGDREDFLRVYDAHTLNLSQEIPIPPRALAVFKGPDLGVSPDGKWAYVFDMSPTTRVTVVDLKANVMRRTIDIPGCALEFPWAHDGFSALCGDGGLMNVGFDGHDVHTTRSKPFFDANENPVFEQSPMDMRAGIAFFITYDGHVFPTTLGPNAAPGASWTLSEAAGQPVAGRGIQEQAWRPGGLQPFAYHAGLHRLYVLMHVGPYWTHKTAGTEIWVIDTRTHARIRRIDLPTPGMAIAVSQDARPQLYAVTGAAHVPGSLSVIDPETGHVLHDIKANARPMAVTAGF